MLIYTFFLNLNALHTPCTHLSLLFQCFVYLHLHAAASGTSSWGCGKGSSRNQKKYLFRNRCSVKACNTAGTSLHSAVVNRRVFHQQLYFSETLVEILRDRRTRHTGQQLLDRLSYVELTFACKVKMTRNPNSFTIKSWAPFPAQPSISL